MKQRIEYIDNIKGFAIFLVVMGHVIANWFDDFHSVLSLGSADSQLLVWKLIYAFHMPLFMFCSGLFQPQMSLESTIKDVITIIWKRFRAIMIPYFAGGVLLLYITGKPSFYWFLLVVFEFSVINLLISFTSTRFSRHSNAIEGGLLLAIYIAVHIFTTRFSSYERLPFFDINHLGLYAYFTLGFLASKYGILNKILEKNYIYTMSVLAFIILHIMNSCYDMSFTKGGILFNPVKPLAAIFCVFYLFKNFKMNRHLTGYFNTLGRMSLDIYILHFFFLLKMPEIGSLIGSISQNGGGTFVIGICIAIVLSVINIVFCQVFSFVVSKSHLLSLILLGKNENRASKPTLRQ